MSWDTQLEQVCGAANRSEVTVETFGASRVLPWVDIDDEEQLRQLLRLAAVESRRVLPAGAGEHLPAEALVRADVLVSLRRRNQIIDYESADLTMVAQAGVTLRQLDTAVAAEKQSLAVDCARGTHATLGGAVAADRSGLDAFRHGTWRDHVLGARVMHADGTVTRTGSRVVKSVSGYDLAKLYVGSQGCLVLLLDVNLRLLCHLQETGTVRATLPHVDAAQGIQKLYEDRTLQPSSLLIVSQPDEPRPSGHVDVIVRFAGRSEVVAQQLERCQQHLGGQVLQENAARRLADQLRQQCEPVTGKPWMRITALPVEILVHALRCAPQLDVHSGFVVQYGVGIAHFCLSADSSRALRELPAPAQRAQARVVWGNVPHEEAAGSPGQGSPALSKLRHSIRDSFDASGILIGGGEW